jgi:hypothetical protein
MVGNDVVDLADQDCQPGRTHARFDRRVFSPSELCLIQTSPAPVRMRWTLWAAKESAYKLLRKLDPHVGFAPSRFVVQLDRVARADGRFLGEVDGDGLTTGTVAHGNRCVSFRAVADPEALHVIATDHRGQSRRLLAGVAEASAESPSSAVRRMAIAAIAAALGVAPGELSIVREARIPRLWRHGEPVPIDLSLSHHGRFVAFAAVESLRWSAA